MTPNQLPLHQIPLDAELAERLRASADARVRARIDAAKQTAEHRRATRAEFAQARRHGLAARQAARAHRPNTPSQRPQARQGDDQPVSPPPAQRSRRNT